ncbi:hypothetical protein K2173_022518 [Erythroxylum novogranatense]|uniref:Condensin-2 complex subunit H2 n=1 Tax=Erythroxylum novogranatense TaxID=1862640 RepID=A0AAV8TK12_9ROSI|nr:hypothetical protein K2173_022518 [Erythroxylum novogranatense]
MTNNKEEPGKFHTVQAERDLEANWEVDLAKKLEKYLFKICSGEITGGEEDTCHFPVNFAEAALLVQGSVQVYSRKVEYLYNLVLHALDFLSNKRQQEQSEDTPILPEESNSHAVSVDENDQFWGLNDVPVEPRNRLDTSTSKDASLHHFVKPPANLVVLEGDCLDNTGDNGELESYLLATNDLYRDFILLDHRDALSVNDFLEEVTGKGQNSTYRGNSSRKSFQSPTRRSGGTAHKSSHGKKQNANFNQSPGAGCSFGGNECKLGPDSPVSGNVENSHNAFNVNCGHEEPGNMEDLDNDNEDDPWKPLNPHELGSLRVKPFKKVKAFRRNLANSASIKHISITKLFPLAKLHGPISPELTEMWEAHCKILKNSDKSQSPPLYEKLRESLASGGHNVCDRFAHSGDKNEDNAFDDGVPDFGDAEDNMQENVFMDEDLPFNHEKHDDFPAHLDNNEELGYAEPSSQASLEDLCQSHLDALLANIAETEKQSELAARVSSWKQKIEHNLEEIHTLHLIFMPMVKESLRRYLLKRTWKVLYLLPM